MITPEQAAQQVERSIATHQLMEATSSYFPELIRQYPDGSKRVVSYRFGQRCRAHYRGEAYTWTRGARDIPAYCLRQLIYEILAVAEKERTDLQRVREELSQLKGSANGIKITRA